MQHKLEQERSETHDASSIKCREGRHIFWSVSVMGVPGSIVFMQQQQTEDGFCYSLASEMFVMLQDYKKQSRQHLLLVPCYRVMKGQSGIFSEM